MQNKTLISRGVSLALLMACGNAMAQQSEGADQLEEITVTAQFRSQNLQETPLAITAVTGDMLEARSQTSIYEVAAQAPSVFLAPQAQANGSGLIAYIRGVGQTDFNFALEPGVGLYVDDVYLPTLTGSLLDLLDLDRVEILRGPQGTLAGRNSIGGAIKLFSQACRRQGWQRLAHLWLLRPRRRTRVGRLHAGRRQAVHARRRCQQEPRWLRRSAGLRLHAPGFRRPDAQAFAGLQTRNLGRYFVRRRTPEHALAAVRQRRGQFQRRRHQRQLRGGRRRAAPRACRRCRRRIRASCGPTMAIRPPFRPCRWIAASFRMASTAAIPTSRQSVRELRDLRRLHRTHQPAAFQAGGGARGAAARSVRHVGQHRLDDQRHATR